MDAKPAPFVPPAPRPRQSPPSTLQMMRIVYNNPLELWGEPSYNEKWISISTGIGGPLVIANDPGLIRYVLVENARNYKMARVRQKILRPILRDGLLTAEGDVWKRSRKAMAPVFTPKNIDGFASAMLSTSLEFAERYRDADRADISRDMTMLTYDILAETLFSGEIAGEPGSFAHQVDRLFETMGRVDPMDLLGAPDWLPRFTRIRGKKSLAFFRKIVADTVRLRRTRMDRGEDVPADFLTLLLKAEGPDGLARSEIEDNIITFIGAGHETTARALGWTLYCLAEAPWEREKIEAEIDAAMAVDLPPQDWLAAMPSPAQPSRRRCGSTRPPRRSTARRSQPTATRTSRSSRARRFSSCRGRCIVTARSGTIRKPSSRPASIRKTATRSTATSISPSAPARASASAPPSPCRKRSSRSPS